MTARAKRGGRLRGERKRRGCGEAVSGLPGPAGRRLLRACDADREHAAEALRAAAGEGRITLEELDDRIQRAYAASTYADLEALTRDLPAQPAAAGARPPAVRGPGPGRVGGVPDATFSLAVMGEARRDGRWVVPAAFTALALMGAAELDLRQARFSEREVTIHAIAIMGGVRVTVPEDLDVSVSGLALLGEADRRAAGPGAAGAPRVRVICYALMGGVEVRRAPAPRG